MFRSNTNSFLKVSNNWVFQPVDVAAVTLNMKRIKRIVPAAIDVSKSQT
jgi:hypothetical protein